MEAYMNAPKVKPQRTTKNSSLLPERGRGGTLEHGIYYWYLPRSNVPPRPRSGKRLEFFFVRCGFTFGAAGSCFGEA